MNSPSQPRTGAVRAFIVSVLLAVYRPRVTDSVWQWAEKNIILDREQSPAFPGPYDSSITPYTRFIQEFFTDQYTNVEFANPNKRYYREFVLRKSSQVGFTEAVLNNVRYAVANRPMEMGYVIDSRDEVKKISKKRLQPTLERCPATRAAILPNEDEFGMMTMYLRGSTIYMMGSYAVGPLSNKPLGFVVLDELDKHEKAPQGEAETIDLARGRMKTIDDAKLIALSTPKSEHGITHREYLTGTQHKYFVPCPHCAAMQTLEWHRVKFDHCKDLAGEYDLERVEKETHYQCCACEEKIEERHKREMVLNGVWRQTNPKPDDPDKITATISDLYSPFNSVRWGKLAITWLNAKRVGGRKLQDFFNNHLGEPLKQGQSEVKEADVLKLRGAYKRGQCPFEPVLVTMCADKQQDVLKYSKAGFKLNGEMAILDYGYVLVEDELLDRADERIEVLGSTSRPCVKFGLIDEGYKATEEVRPFVLRSNGRFSASKGRGGIQVTQPLRASTAAVGLNSITVYHYDDDEFKKQLYINRIAKHDDIISGKSRVPRLWLPMDIEPNFVAELTGERLIEVKNKYGFTSMKWDVTGHNDFGDTVKMHLVLWHLLGPVLLELHKQAA